MSFRISAATVLSALLLAGCASTQTPQPKPPPAPVQDQRALDMLKKMSDALTKAQTLSFTCRSMTPVRGPGGLWINLFGESDVVRQGADKLYVQNKGDFFPHDFYFDGKTATLFSPEKKFYSQKSESGTIDGLINNAINQEGKSFPFADLLVADPYKTLTKNIVKSVYIGQTVIAGVKTNHLAFVNSAVEWQIWIGADDNLPRYVCATYPSDSGEPSWTVDFSGWKVNSPVPPDTFVFKNTSNAVKVEFKNPGQPR